MLPARSLAPEPKAQGRRVRRARAVVELRVLIHSHHLPGLRCESPACLTMPGVTHMHPAGTREGLRASEPTGWGLVLLLRWHLGSLPRQGPLCSRSLSPGPLFLPGPHGVSSAWGSPLLAPWLHPPSPTPDLEYLSPG